MAAVRRMARREQTVAEVRRRLRLSPDARIPSDDAYIAAWLDWGFSPALIELAFRPHRAELRPPELEILSRNSGKLAEKRPVHRFGHIRKGRAAPKAGNPAGTGRSLALHPLIPRENRHKRTELGKFCPFTELYKVLKTCSAGRKIGVITCI